MSAREENNIRDVDSLSDTVESGPSYIWIEPTTRCNIRCLYCDHHYKNFGQDMPIAVYEKIRANVLDNVRDAILTGYGETFLAKNWDMISDDCIRRGVSITAISNGTLLGNENLLSRIVRSDVNLYLSIDGVRDETHSHLRPGAEWKKMLETLERIKRAAEKAGSERRFSLGFNFVAMKRNIADLPDMVRLAARYNAREVFVFPLSREDQMRKVSGESLHDSPELVSPAYLSALSLAAKTGVSLYVPPSFREMILLGKERGNGLNGKLLYQWRKLRRGIISLRQKGLLPTLQRFFKGHGPRGKAGISLCTYPWRAAYFDASGSVFPCCFKVESVGDLNREEWSDIWNNALYKNLRRTIHGWNPTSLCRYCSLPFGVNGGDEHYYEKYFGKFRREVVPLNADGVNFGEGFHELEFLPDGSPSHHWMSRRARLTLPKKNDARFLRLTTSPRYPFNIINPGRCVINGGRTEFFDNTCADINLPISDAAGGCIEIDFEMEYTHKVGDDPRELSINIQRLEYLF